MSNHEQRFNTLTTETHMTESITRKTMTNDEHNSPGETTYKVWIDIEEYDELSGSGNDCDAPGGALATFDTYEEAYEFAEQIDQAYSTHSRNVGTPLEDISMATKTDDSDATPLLPGRVTEALDALLSYLWDSERTDYEQCQPDDKRKHIFRHLQTLSRWLQLRATQTK